MWQQGYAQLTPGSMNPVAAAAAAALANQYGYPPMMASNQPFTLAPNGTNTAPAAHTPHNPFEPPTGQDEEELFERDGSRSAKFKMRDDPTRTYGLNPAIVKTILAAEYFKSLHEVRLFSKVVDEIYNEVKHVEPYINAARVPSTAFCIVYKFFLMGLTVKQVQSLLKHKDSPYIRATGFLFLRYACEPADLFQWFQGYLYDKQEFTPGLDKSKKLTMGQFTRQLLDDQHYYSIVLPRIPVPIARDIKAKLVFNDLMQAKSAENELYRKNIKSGQKMKIRYSEDNEYYEAVIDEVLESGKFLVTFDGYNNQEEVDIGCLDIPDQLKRKKSSRSPRRRSRSRSRSRGRGRRSRSGSRNRDRNRRRSSRSRSRDRSSRRRSRSRERSSRRRSRSRSRSRSRDRDQNATSSSSGTDMKALADEIIRRERESAVAQGHDYARRPTSYKQSLSTVVPTSAPRRSRSPARREVVVERKRTESPPRKKEMSASQKAKMLELKAKYGDASASSDKKGDRGNGGSDTDVLRLGF